MLEKTQIGSLAGDWAKAELDADTSFLGEILADDFVAIGPRGFVLSKEEWIERHESGRLTYEDLDLTEVRVRTYGEAAVLTGRQVGRSVYRDGERRFEMTDDLRVTVIFASVGDRTSIVGIQMSSIAGPPA